MIKKAIIPVAGLGTRFLPASKSIPKEMVTIVDKPAIDYVVKEAIAAGIDEIILVTHSAKSSIENYFDRNIELELALKTKGKLTILEEIMNIIPSNVSIASIRQPEPLGLGHAILCAKSLVGDQDFAVLLPDVLVKNSRDEHDLTQMIERYTMTKIPQIMVESVPLSEVDQYGIVDVEYEPKKGESTLIKGIIEKPSPEKAPSSLSVVGRYLLPSTIMNMLEQTPKGVGGEIQLTDAIAQLQKDMKIEAYRMYGKSFDCGSKLGYLNAVLYYGIDHPKLGNDFRKMIKNIQI